MSSDPRPGSATSLWLRPTALVDVGARLAAPGLLHEAARGRLARLPADFPPIGFVGAFEVRLEAEDAVVDFEMCLRADPRTREELAAYLDGEEAARLGARCVAWARTLRFLHEWIDPTTGLSEAAPVLWIEFDTGLDGEPEPFVVLTLDRERFHPDGVGDRPRLADFLVRALALAGGGLDARTEAALRRCVAGLPRATEFAHAAVRPSPVGDAVRLIVRLPANGLPEALERLGWPGSGMELRGVLERMFTTRAVHPVNLDVGERLGPRVGLEFHHPTSPRRDPRWRRFLDALEAAGACAPAQRRRVEVWPLEECEGSGLLRVERDLLVKVVHAPGMPLRAKAYLPFSIQLSRAAALAAAAG